MKLDVDREADALYLRLDDSEIVRSEEVSPGVVLDYNESNEVVGVEMLRLSKRSPGLDLSVLEFEAALMVEEPAPSAGAVETPPTPTPRRSALDILADGPARRLFKTAAEVDACIRAERESWDR